MKRGGWAGFAIALVAAEVVLRLGALGALPEMVRLALAFAAIVLLPGACLTALLAPAPVVPGGAVRALGFGVAWNAAVILTLHLAQVPFTRLLEWGPAIHAVLVAATVLRARQQAGSSPGDPRLSRLALAAVMAAAVLASVHAGRTGTIMSYYSDSPDHVGSIRRMLQTGNAFPTDAFFKDAGPSGADPRKGLWHPQVALIVALARVDPADAWRQLPAAIAPFFILVLAQLGLLGAGGAGAAAFAWAHLLLLAGATTWFPLRKAVYGTFLADELSMAAAFAALADALRPQRASRIAAVGLALGAIATHVYSAIQLAMTLGGLAAGLVLRDRAARPAGRLVVTGLAIGVLGLPYLMWRAHQSYAPANIIHTETQGLLWLGGSLRVVSIGVLWDWMSTLWILFPIAWLALARRRGDPAALYVLTTSLVVALVIFDPPVVALLEPRLGYLLMRMIWMVPIGALVGWLALALARAAAAAAEPPARRRLLAVSGLVALGLFLMPTARDALATFTDPQRFAHADRDESPFRWREALAWMDRELPPGQVVLADPATSYGVPMLTRHYVATLVDQHSSPSDSLALTRILDARDALDPYASWARTREVVDRYGVTVIAINADFPRIPPLDFWSPSPRWAAEARSRFDARPAAFERVYDRGGFTVYRVHRTALDTLSGPPAPRPFVVPYVAGRFPIGRRFDDHLPVVHRLTLWPPRVARGDTLHGVAEWRALQSLRGGSYLVSVRFEGRMPGGFAPPAWMAKPARKVLERLRHERYRFRDDHLPTAGAYGVDLWRPDEIVRDSFDYVVPADVAPGYYRTEIRMNRSPHYPNFHLGDYFFERDYFSGVPMGMIEVVASRAALAAPPAPIPPELQETH